MSSFYHPATGARRRGVSLGVAVAVVLAALAATQVKGSAATAADIALITAIALIATGIIGAGTYLVVRAARRPPLAPPPPSIRVTATVIRPADAAMPQGHRPAIQAKRPVSDTARGALAIERRADA